VARLEVTLAPWLVREDWMEDSTEAMLEMTELPRERTLLMKLEALAVLIVLVSVWIVPWAKAIGARAARMRVAFMVMVFGG